MNNKPFFLRAALLAAVLGASAPALHNSVLMTSPPVIRQVSPNGPGRAPLPLRMKPRHRHSTRRISVAESKRRSIKRRNRQRHKAHCRG